MVCADETEAGRLAGDLEVLLGKKPLRLFARELFVRAGTVISRQWEHSRIAALYELTQGRGRVAVATAEGLLQKTSPPQALCDAAVKLETGGRYGWASRARRWSSSSRRRSQSWA